MAAPTPTQASTAVHPRLSVNALSTWHWTFEQDLALWRELALHHAGLWRRKLAQDWRPQVAAVRAAGIEATTVVSGRFDLADPGSWPEQRRFVAESADIVTSLGGSSVYITPGRHDGRPWSELAEAFVAAAGPAAVEVALRGAQLSIEPTLRADVSFANSLRDGIDLAVASGVALVVDFGNCWLERDLEAVLRRAAPHIGLVQLADIRVGPDASPSGDRVLPGEGQLDLRRLIGAVLDAGYEGVFDIEVVGPQIEREGYRPALLRGVERASQLLVSLGI